MSDALTKWLSTATISHAKYGPEELARISGLTPDMQRVWRRKGNIRALTMAKTHFSISETLEITLLCAMSKAGIDPREVKLDLAQTTQAAIFHAIFSDGGCEVVGPSVDVESFERCFLEDDGELGRLLVKAPQHGNYLALNEFHEMRVFQDPHQMVPVADELSLVFDLGVIGGRLVERGRKPVVTVKFPDLMGIRSVRCLVGVAANDP